MFWSLEFGYYLEFEYYDLGFQWRVRENTSLLTEFDRADFDLNPGTSHKPVAISVRKILCFPYRIIIHIHRRAAKAAENLFLLYFPLRGRKV